MKKKDLIFYHEPLLFGPECSSEGPKPKTPDRFSEERQIGLIAQEVCEVVPQVVSEDDNGYYNIDYPKLTPLLIEAIKELTAQNKDLQARLEALERE